MKKPSRDWYDFVTLGVGGLGVIGVVATIAIGRFDQKSNGKDVRDAIGRMADIATAMQNQKPLLEKQAKAAADSAAAAKTTASLAKDQTDAVVQQAHSLMASAQATMKAAESQLAAAQANIKTAQEGAKAARANLDAAGVLASSRIPVGRLSSVQIGNWTGAVEKDGTVKVTIKPVFTNVGGGTLMPGVTTFGVLLAETYPEKPPEIQRAFGSNENPIGPSGTFYPQKPFEYNLKKTDIELVDAGKRGIVVWGVMHFNDATGKSYTTCYLAVAETPTVNDVGGAVRAVDLPAFRC